MPEENKTEAPTPRRREEARKKGQIFKSAEVNSVATWLGGLILFYYAGTSFIGVITSFMKNSLKDLGSSAFSTFSPEALFSVPLYVLAALLLPFMGVIFLVGLVSNMTQVGFLWTAYPLLPKLERINPMAGFSRIFSMRGLIECLKSLLKLICIGYVVYVTLRKDFPVLLGLSHVSPAQTLMVTGRMAFDLGIRVAGLWAAIAVLDYFYQRWEYERNLRMSRQELKDELRQSEGDPHMRSHIRQRQRRISMQRMMQEVPKSSVVLTNPTALAVALRYDEPAMRAPRVVAKGGGILARRIIETAGRYSVPILQNRELARVLFRTVEVGDEIPPSLYHAVAEVIAYIYALKGMEIK